MGNVFCMRLVWSVWIAVFFVWGRPAAVAAHGPLDEQIAQVTKDIRQHPNDPILYLKRGELHHFHEDWPAALADYDTAANLDSKLSIVDLYRSKTLLAASQPQEAMAALDRLFLHNPNHIDGLLTRARTLVRLSQYETAAIDYTKVIDSIETVPPELFVERAQALERAGESHYSAALTGLDDGLQKIGQVVTLQLFAIELELKLSHYDAALARLEQISAISRRKEKWLMRKGEILHKAGRGVEAGDAYRQALLEIERLPPTRRRNKAVMEMERGIHSALQDLGAK
ncbi:MAG TPA: tetratricopeptide repeat protein [bacterium]